MHAIWKLNAALAQIWRTPKLQCTCPSSTRSCICMLLADMGPCTLQDVQSNVKYVLRFKNYTTPRVSPRVDFLCVCFVLEHTIES